MARTITIEPLGPARQATFRVTLVFFIQDADLQARLRPNDGGFGDGESVQGHGEIFRFPVECVSDGEELDRCLALLRLRERSGQFLVISDLLTERDSEGKPRPSRLASQIRESFRAGRHLCGLIGIDRDAKGRVHDLDQVVSALADRDVLRQAVLSAAMGLRLKAPPPASDGGVKAAGVKIEAAQSLEQLKQCLALRKHVYGLMGYLPDDVMMDPSGIELDGYDERSIHFAATRGGEVVGTVRLVLELPAGRLPEPDTDFAFRALLTQRHHADWCRQIVQDAGPAIRGRLANPPFMPLPILESSEFNKRWSQTLRETPPGGELSRLVVKPEYRGLHLSADLVRAVFAKAYEMGRQVVLLECIPSHEDMYYKYGFRRMKGDPHSRPTDLDQYAVAMWLRFDESRNAADNAATFLNRIRMGLLPRFGALDTPLRGR
jgi:predicted GNAT family N-acyltransferase